MVWCSDGLHGFGCGTDGALGTLDSVADDGAPVTQATKLTFFDDKAIKSVAAGAQPTALPRAGAVPFKGYRSSW